MQWESRLRETRGIVTLFGKRIGRSREVMMETSEGGKAAVCRLFNQGLHNFSNSC